MSKAFFLHGLLSSCLVLALSLSYADTQDIHNAFIEIYQNENGNAEAAGLVSVNIAVKDNIDIEGRVTSAGSLALAGNVAAQDAFLIQKLRSSDFRIFGKTNLSEWANFRSTNSVSGWSSYGGQTTNIVGKNYNPCGSSSGSAVAVAAGIVDVAVGTETNGSISCPASVNGVVGMKPTVGLVSRRGIIPIAASQDTAGPIGNSVAIVAQTLAAMAGADAQDPATAAIPSNFDYDLAAAAFVRSLQGKRFGLLSSGIEYPQSQGFLQSLTDMVQRLGGEIVTVDDARIYPSDESYLVLLYEFKRGLEAYLAAATEPKKSLAALIEFNAQHRSTVMPYFGQEIFEQAILVQNEEVAYQAALQAIEEVREETLALMDDNDLDGFIGLTRGPAWQIDYVGGDDAAAKRAPQFGNGHFAAISGLPHITLPGFEIDGLPVGISLIGSPWSDKALLGYAAALEALISSNASVKH